MNEWLLIGFATFGCVVLLTGLIIPQILLIAFRKKLFDVPEERKVHKGVVPRLGGIAFLPAILFALLILFGLGTIANDRSIPSQVLSNLLPMCLTCAAAILLYLTGMADDLVGVRYRAKFVMQAIAGGILILAGIRIHNLNGFFGLYELPVVPSILLTLLVIIFIINAINLIDGIDGLASGLSSIACVYYIYVFMESGYYIHAALAFAVLGALMPFFVFNVFGNALKHQKIFMGDTGALTIGLFLSAMSIEISSMESSINGFNPTAIAFAPLLIPGFDVVRVYLHRIKAGRNPFMPDKTHIHHKLLALGMRQRVAMPIIIGSNIILTAANFIVSPHLNITILFFSDIALWICINMILTRAIFAREKQLGISLYE